MRFQPIRSETLFVQIYKTGAALLESAGSFLMVAEAENNAILSAATSPQVEIALLEGRAVFLAALNRAGSTECVASNHQDAGVFLSESTHEGAIALCNHLAQHAEVIKRVLLPKSVAAEWIEAWMAHRQCTSKLNMNTRSYCCNRVQWPRSSPGGMRAALNADADQIARWQQAFRREAWASEEPLETFLPGVERAIEQRRIYIWVDQEPVSYLLSGRHTPNGARVIQVFTPSEHRGRGYASNLTAQVTQKLLEEGRKFCVLDTDLTNTTSNHIYREIGYQAICDRQEWHFSYAN
jgi:hypothetical protein